jgi:hypothetical protein
MDECVELALFDQEMRYSQLGGASSRSGLDRDDKYEGDSSCRFSLRARR